MSNGHWVFCEHCGKLFYAQRSTARFCGDTCRQRSKRGMPAPAYQGDDTQIENALALIAEHAPSAFTALTELKERYGAKAVKLATRAILETVGHDKFTR